MKSLFMICLLSLLGTGFGAPVVSEDPIWIRKNANAFLIPTQLVEKEVLGRLVAAFGQPAANIGGVDADGVQMKPVVTDGGSTTISY